MLDFTFASTRYKTEAVIAPSGTPGPWGFRGCVRNSTSGTSSSVASDNSRWSVVNDSRSNTAISDPDTRFSSVEYVANSGCVMDCAPKN